MRSNLFLASRRRFLQCGFAAGVAAAFPRIAFAQSEATRAATRMAEGRPSATAEGAALLRAAHQLIDVPWILDDPLALPVIEIVFSYSVLTSMLTEAQRAARERSEKEVAAVGEPWLTYFDPDVLAGDLGSLGFRATYDLTSEEANARYFSGRIDGLRVSGSGRLMKATV